MKKTTHFTEAVRQHMMERTDRLSSYASNALTAMTIIAKEELPELSKEEWDELIKLYQYAELIKIKLPLNLAKDILNYSHRSKVSETLQQLIIKLVNMSQAQQFAIIDHLRFIRFQNEKKD